MSSSLPRWGRSFKCKDTYAAVKTVTPMLEAAAQTGLHYLSRPPEPLPKAAGEYRYRIEEADLLRALLSVLTRGGAASTDTLQSGSAPTHHLQCAR